MQSIRLAKYIYNACFLIVFPARRHTTMRKISLFSYVISHNYSDKWNRNWSSGPRALANDKALNHNWINLSTRLFGRKSSFFLDTFAIKFIDEKIKAPVRYIYLFRVITQQTFHDPRNKIEFPHPNRIQSWIYGVDLICNNIDWSATIVYQIIIITQFNIQPMQ